VISSAGGEIAVDPDRRWREGSGKARAFVVLAIRLDTGLE
jgi:hypothetical protein